MVEPESRMPTDWGATEGTLTPVAETDLMATAYEVTLVSSALGMGLMGRVARLPRNLAESMPPKRMVPDVA